MRMGVSLERANAAGDTDDASCRRLADGGSIARVTASVPKKMVSVSRRPALRSTVAGGPSAGSLMPAFEQDVKPLEFARRP